MSLELITAIGRWLLPVLAGLILVSCGGVLIRGNRKTGTIGYVVNAANGDSMALRQFETSIGRSKLCDIVLNYNTVSRFHAVIARRGGKWILFDTNSKTGTYVNKDRVVEKKFLENGDTLIFGNAMFKFYEELPEVITPNYSNAYAKPEQNEKQFMYDDRRAPGDIVIPQMVREAGCNLENCITGEVMEIDDMDEVLIGRSEESHIRINRQSVSKYHALVSRNAHGRWMIEDLDSVAGTLLNGVEVNEPMPLHDSDIIEVCGYTIKFNDPR
ncbi:MAG: FHA domain-containing protein [Clostridia bacterium]|nr:FHA domain-containing protein [Clostridia bacterium]